MKEILIRTQRLLIREIDSSLDARFIHELLNSPKFVQYIGDRGVRSVDEARDFIETRFRQSYRDHGFGLYSVELKADGTQIGICGFVRRNTLPGPDIGFAFLPEFERKGYGYESAAAMMNYGRETLGFGEVLAITTLDNDASIGLLEKLGFKFERLIESPEGETIRLFKNNLN